jgi:hypothetical protein
MRPMVSRIYSISTSETSTALPSDSYTAFRAKGLLVDYRMESADV